MPERALRPLLPLVTTILLAAALLATTARAGEVVGVDGVTVDVRDPERVVALNASVLEIVYELGQGDTLVGTDGSGTYPPNDLPSVGHPYNYAVEGLLSLEPDLVISAEENMKPETAAQLRDAGVQVLVLSHSGENGMEGLFERIEAIATAYDVPEEGRRLVERVRSEAAALEEALAEQVAPEERLEVLFIYSHSLGDSTIYGGTGTGPGTLIAMAGAIDAGAFVDAAHVPITSEALVTANPDAIVMLERGLEAVGGVDGYVQLPGVSLTSAGQDRAVYTVDNSIRWIGPRFPAFARELAETLYDLDLP